VPSTPRGQLCSVRGCSIWACALKALQRNLLCKGPDRGGALGRARLRLASTWACSHSTPLGLGWGARGGCTHQERHAWRMPATSCRRCVAVLVLLGPSSAFGRLRATLPQAGSRPCTQASLAPRRHTGTGTREGCFSGHRGQQVHTSGVGAWPRPRPGPHRTRARAP